MDPHLGIICRACGLVTLFEPDAPRPFRCARCAGQDQRDPPRGGPLAGTPTRPGFRRLPLTPAHLDWIE